MISIVGQALPCIAFACWTWRFETDEVDGGDPTGEAERGNRGFRSSSETLAFQGKGGICCLGSGYLRG